MWFHYSKQINTKQLLTHFPYTGIGERIGKAKLPELIHWDDSILPDKTVAMWVSWTKHGIHTPHKICSWEYKLQYSQSSSFSSFFAPAFIIEHDTVCYTVWVSCPGCVSSQLPVHLQFIAGRAVWEAEISVDLSKHCLAATE